jgi:hypothetical protein
MNKLIVAIVFLICLLPGLAHGQTYISSCQTLSYSGSYELSANISQGSTDAPCITIAAASVTLNCAGYSITGTSHSYFSSPIIVVNGGSNNYKIENCSFNFGSTTFNGAVFFINVCGPYSNIVNDELSNCASQSNYGNITGNTFGSATMSIWFAAVIVGGANYTKFESNTMYGSYSQGFSNNSTISGNTIYCENASAGLGCAYQILSENGGSNTIESNSLYGDSQGPLSDEGTDDNVLLVDENNDSVSSNTLKNSWDCAVETWGNMTYLSVYGNNIYNTTNAVCSYYYTSWKNVTVSYNHAYSVSSLYRIGRLIGCLRTANEFYPGSPADTAVYFSNNTFSHNVLESLTSAGPWPYISPGYVELYSGYDGGGNLVIPFDIDGVGSYDNTGSCGPETNITWSVVTLTGNEWDNNNYGNFPYTPGSQPWATNGGPWFWDDSVFQGLYNVGTDPDVWPPSFPSGRVADGGGNSCPTTNNVGTYPITCH